MDDLVLLTMGDNIVRLVYGKPWVTEALRNLTLGHSLETVKVELGSSGWEEVDPSTQADHRIHRECDTEGYTKHFFVLKADVKYPIFQEQIL